MSVIHLSYAADGGAGRAGRRASLACQRAGLASSFAFVAGEPSQPGDIQFAAARAEPAKPPTLGQTLKDRLQWDFVPGRRTPVSNTLFSVPYPGIDVAGSRAAQTADILHLHWPTWMVTPRAVADWLAAGRAVMWTLHDAWAMTGGCHYPTGCDQFRSVCLKCPQLAGDRGLVANAFAEKRAAWGGAAGNLTIVAPSRWMAQTARASAILGGRPIHVVRNAIELDVFRPCADRAALRAAFGVAEQDALIFLGSFDLGERRKGAALLLQALRDALADGGVAAALPPGGRLHLAMVGKAPEIAPCEGLHLMACGQVDDDAVMADLLGIADLVAVPSLEDNYPNMIVEALACGTPCLGYAAGGIAEMIEDGVTGVLAREVGSVASLAEALLRFLSRHAFDPAMRAAARASAERWNDPAAIGRQLAALYETALGRPLAAGPAPLRQRMLAAFAQSPPSEDARLGAELLRFPFNHALAAMAPERLRPAVTLPAQPRAAALPRVLAVRAVHEHHSARSGPYQFARHLDPARFETSHMAAPLGADLAGDLAGAFRRAGALAGATAFGKQGNAWLAEAEIMARCAAEPFDLIHYIDGEINGALLPGLPAELFAGGRRPAFVATYHQPPDLLAGMAPPAALRRWDAIVALCGSQAEAIRRHVPAERVSVIPHGVATDFFHPPPAGRTREAGAPFRLLLVGHWLRDIAAARAACARLRADGVGFELTVISPDLSLRGIDPQVRFLSGLSDEDLRAAYWDADALFLPLLDATANNAVLEALACGLPVISTDVGGVGEAVGAEAGVVCPPGDAEALADAVRRLAGAPESLSVMRGAARGRAEALRWPNIAALHERLYAAVAEGRR